MTKANDLALRAVVLQLSPIVELQQSIASRVADISPCVDQLMQFLEPFTGKLRIEDGSDVAIEIAAREAIANAIIHGNRENPLKRVQVICRCNAEGDVVITVEDEGRGFDSRTLPDPTDQANLLLTHGRGVRLMQTLMDDVDFQENGTIVRMRKLLGPHMQE